MCLLLKPQTSSSVVDSSRIDVATTGEVTITTTSTVDKCCLLCTNLILLRSLIIAIIRCAIQSYYKSVSFTVVMVGTIHDVLWMS